MKRAIIALVLMTAMIGTCVLSIIMLNDIKKEFDEAFSGLEALAERGNRTETADEAKRITKLWVEKHHTLCRIVRHTQLDQVTLAVARFEPLARHGETAELTAELSRCRILLEDIYDSELPLIRNII